MCDREGAAGWGHGLGCSRAWRGLGANCAAGEDAGIWLLVHDHLSVVDTPQEMLKWRRVLRDVPKRGKC